MKQLYSLFAILALPAVTIGQDDAVWEEKSVAEWVEALNDDDDRVQWYATYALGQLGTNASEAVEPLVVHGQGSKPQIRKTVINLLEEVGLGERFLEAYPRN